MIDRVLAKYVRSAKAFWFFCKRHNTKNCAAVYICKSPMNKKQKLKHKYIPEKFKNVESFSFTTINDELMVVFHGFDQELDMSDFADYLFNKIGMNYHHIKGPPTIH